MKNSIYIEDIFLNAMNIMSHNQLGMQHQDRSAAYSFVNTLMNGDSITQNQANYILRILNKYKNSIKPYYDYQDYLTTPAWRKPFRVIDNTKKIWIDISEGITYICLKFPFQFKEIYENTINIKGIWDKNNSRRMIPIYDANIIQLYEFSKSHDFEIDDTFMEAVSAVEEIWQNSENFSRSSYINDGGVFLKNAPEDALNYFENKKKGNVDNDLFLAKSMGYIFQGKPNTPIEKIAATAGNFFSMSSIEEFLKLSFKLNGKICIILDRAADSLEWLKSLATSIDKLNLPRNDFRVCVRANKTEPNNEEFNEWVRDNNFGGKISTAKVLIFQHKAAKWLFKEENDVILIASNMLYPATYSQTKALILNHPCFVYIGDIKPTTIELKGTDICEL
jgi:hypothetical protein